MFRAVVLSTCLNLACLLSTCPGLLAGEGNRLDYLDHCDPWYPGSEHPKLLTPQWVGEDGVECVVVLAIDDMRDTAKYEQYLRPILNRLKQIDGRAPVSIMTCGADPADPQLQSWLEEGLSIECHTVDHPCPLLQGGDFDRAASTFHRCIDLLSKIPGNQPVAFRTPCCDSLNTVSPRFYSEIFPRASSDGKYLQIDSSVMNFFTSEDETIPPELVLDKDGNERFWKYKVRNLKRGDVVHNDFVNYIKNYPYPYVINQTCWQFPCVAPSDWSAQHLHGVNNPQTVEDWKAALDITVLKRGVFNLVFHPHGWITAEQVVELIDHAAQKHGTKVKFLTFREAADRLQRNLIPGSQVSLNTGSDSGVRLIDVDRDQVMDVIVSRQEARQTRIWNPIDSVWSPVPFPADFENPDDFIGPGNTSFGLHAGRLVVAFPNPDRAVPKDKDGTNSGDAFLKVWPGLKFAEWKEGAWALLGAVTAVTDDTGASFAGPMLGSTCWRDLNGDGSDELIALASEGTMDHIRTMVMVGRLQPDGTIKFTEANFPGHLGLHNPGLLSSRCFDQTPSGDSRLAASSWPNSSSPFLFRDLDGDRDLDLVYSDCSDFCVFLYDADKQEWNDVVVRGKHEQPAGDSRAGVLPIERRNFQNNGFFVHDRRLCWQNEDTSHLPDLIHCVAFDELLSEQQAAGRHNEPEDEVSGIDAKPQTGISADQPKAELPPVLVGAAVVDITPDYPVRLTGYGNRTSESEAVAVPIHARALVIGGTPPAAKPNAISEADVGPACRAGLSPEVGPACRAGLPPQADQFSGLARQNLNGTVDDGRQQDHPDAEPVSPADVPLSVLITVDNCGVPGAVTEQVFKRVAAKHGIARARFAISSTHTHSGPWLRGFAPGILTELPEDHAAHLQQYEADLINKLVDVVDRAVLGRQAAVLSIGRGQLGFAVNRRVLQDGQWTGFGETPDGPTDHQFSILAAHDTAGKLITVLANYACHATTETGTFNQISGDWPGFAADMIEASHPGAVALIAIGCGADANPSPRGTHEQARQHGRAVADEVQRLLGQAAAAPDSLRRIAPDLSCRMERIDLPLGPLPSRAEWEERAQQPAHVGAHAKRFLQLLEDGKSIPTTIRDYPVQTWCFGKDLAMVFLGGEVVVDYAIRLNEMCDSEKLWINAYSNDVPCYIASRRILREGGYEADRSMIYYDRPTRLAPETEDLICDTVQKLLPHHFYSQELQSAFPAPKSPQESLACITTRRNLRAELVAAEPLIRDPVAFDWDVQGRLWVVEMGGYPAGAPASEAPGEPEGKNPIVNNGRVRVLEDTDGDGQYDKATTFLDGLNFPNGIHPWRHGMLITAAPDIIFAADTDGDLKADVRQVLYTGFVEGNQQHRVNGLRWGLDGWLYLANGDSGGEIVNKAALLDGQQTGSSAATGIRGRDLRIQPDYGWLDTLSGQTQFGRERDDFGNWFGNNNSNPIWQYVLEDRYLRRNPHATGLATRAEVAAIPGAAPVFPTSRTLARFNDFDKANRFTSACSTAIYRDNVLGAEFYGNALTCEPVHNLVSRLVLKSDGITFRGRRADDEQDSEFLASSDNWTRPVMVRTGPDGAVYIADMYRQVIEHPTWIPPEYQRKLNLRAGEDRGRIYRIVPVDWPEFAGGQPRSRQQTPATGESSGELTESAAPQAIVATAPCCGTDDATGGDDLKASEPLRQWFALPWNQIPPEELVERLCSSNGWWRDTAHRLLTHADREEIPVNRLIEISLQHPDAAVRVQSMATLSQVGGEPQFDASIFGHLLKDANANVRRMALRLLEDWLSQPSSPLPTQVAALADDPSPSVRRQLALTLGFCGDPAASVTLAQLLQRDAASGQITDAVMTSLTPANIGPVLQHLTQGESTLKAGTEVLTWRLAALAIAMKQSDVAMETTIRLLHILTDRQEAEAWTAAAQAIAGMRRLPEMAGARSDHPVNQALTAARKTAASTAADSEQSMELRSSAVQFVGAAGPVNRETRELLTELIQPATPPEIQLAAAGILTESPAAMDSLFDRWRSLTPSVRSAIVNRLLERPEGSRQLLEAVATGPISAQDLDASCRERLLSHRDKGIRDDARELLGADRPSPRSSVVDDYRRKLMGHTGNAAEGKAVFEKRCAVCHRLQNIGKQIGADLAALKDRSREAMLTAILDPNKAVEAKFLSYTAVTADGRSVSGMLLDETSNSITLLGVDGKQQVIARNELDEVVCSNRSLMPEGLEKDLPIQDLADVIAFVQSSGIKWKQFDGNSPRVIVAEADNSILLPASAAQIYGPALVFEKQYENLGWWQSTDDHAVWSIDVPRSGYWTVEVDYACDDGTAGGLLRLSTGTRLLTARVPGTGTWDNYRTWTVGKLDLGRGRQELVVTAQEKPASALIDLRAIRLIPPD